MPVPAADAPCPSVVLMSTIAASAPDVSPEPWMLRVAITAVAAALAPRTTSNTATAMSFSRDVRRGGGGGS